RPRPRGGARADRATISAPNADLPALIRGRRFRQDLFQRLAVIRLTLPALRERGDDIVLLAEEAMARTCEKYSGPAKKLGDDAMAATLAYRWPGNVRELNSKIEKAVLLCPTPVIPAAALGIGTLPEVIPEAPYGTGDMDLDEFQRRRLSDALSRTGWNISRTAAPPGGPRNTVPRRLRASGV